MLLAERNRMRSFLQITEWPGPAIEPLIHESEMEGFRFLRRLEDEWKACTNRFSGSGEALFGIFEGGRLLAVGGINRQSEGPGRLRRVYVMRSERGKGLGCMLVEHILLFASAHYSRVVLRADTEAADRFYRAIGFSRIPPGGNQTHEIELQPKPCRSG
jgi:GNAT superfamily N-acetyltransferase